MQCDKSLASQCVPKQYPSLCVRRDKIIFSCPMSSGALKIAPQCCSRYFSSQHRVRVRRFADNPIAKLKLFMWMGARKPLATNIVDHVCCSCGTDFEMRVGRNKNVLDAIWVSREEVPTFVVFLHESNEVLLTVLQILSQSIGMGHPSRQLLFANCHDKDRSLLELNLCLQLKKNSRQHDSQ